MRKKISIKIIIITCLISILGMNVQADWGPKFNIHFKNEGNQNADIYVGVDKKATNGWDENVEFEFGNITFQEDYDLPPPPIYSMYIRLIRDTLNYYDTYSYVDIREVPVGESKFKHRYTIDIVWYAITFPPELIVTWGKLPPGIDSAKIRCKEWYMTPDVNMKEQSEMMLDNIAFQTLTVDVWYNASTGINNPITNNENIFPNPTNNIITVINENCQYYYVYDASGKELIKSNLHNLNNDTQDIAIDVSALPTGSYSLVLEQYNGTRKYYSFIKN